MISRLFTFEFPLLANIQQYLMIIAGVWSLILMVIGVTRMHEFSFVKGILTLVISFGIILGVLYLVFIVLLGFPLSISSLTDLLG
ncbi:MAG: hypothetical protein GTN43_05535, partial [Candidatus Aenigmarchaeota archaeon]|nr:hypothetical protein [Candidatus Aenigmarchaeota archaeon]